MAVFATELQATTGALVAADCQGGIGVAPLRAGLASAFAVTEVVIFGFPDQTGMHRPISADKGSLVVGDERAIDVAGIGEEPAAVDGIDAVAEVGVELLGRRVHEGDRCVLRGSVFKIPGRPEEYGVRSMAGCRLRRKANRPRLRRPVRLWRPAWHWLRPESRCCLSCTHRYRSS